MAFEIEWTETAISQLKSLEQFVAQRILKKLRYHSENSYLRNLKKLKGEESFRFRIGDYRILFEITSSDKIMILKVGHRKNIYIK